MWNVVKLIFLFSKKIDFLKNSRFKILRWSGSDNFIKIPNSSIYFNVVHLCSNSIILKKITINVLYRLVTQNKRKKNKSKNRQVKIHYLKITFPLQNHCVLFPKSSCLKPPHMGKCDESSVVGMSAQKNNQQNNNKKKHSLIL